MMRKTPTRKRPRHRSRGRFSWEEGTNPPRRTAESSAKLFIIKPGKSSQNRRFMLMPERQQLPLRKRKTADREHDKADCRANGILPNESPAHRGSIRTRERKPCAQFVPLITALGDAPT